MKESWKKLNFIKAALFLFVFFSPLTFAQSIDEISDLAYNPGNLAMYSYRPSTASSKSPLVILLHGCLQDAKSFAINTGWLDMADRLGITLLMPQQLKINNGVNCFTWYEHGDIVRDKGEVGSIASMIEYMEQKYSIDSERIFVTGISAGATMSAALMASYPEKIKAGALVSGVSYGCAFSLLNSYSCMFAPTYISSQRRGDYIRDASGNYSGNYPEVMIVHGTGDSIVSETNAEHSLEQWLNVHHLNNHVDQTYSLGKYEVDQYLDRNKTVQVEYLIMPKAGHGWPINTQKGCGKNGQFYTDGELCLTSYLANKWGLSASAQ
jgi:poly(hydroxyalkanoate) depolymerase family esterase